MAVPSVCAPMKAQQYAPPPPYPQGYAGERCEEDVDECASAPCQNEATCEDRVGAFACRCPPGYGGNVCEVRLNNCEFQVGINLIIINNW